MERRRLGKTPFTVSTVGLGAEHLEKLPYYDVEKVIHRALERGINIMDAFMAEPEVRTNIGKALGSARQDMVLQGHIGSVWLNGQYGKSRDLALCKQNFEDFMRRIGTDYVDIGMLHFC